MIFEPCKLQEFVGFRGKGRKYREGVVSSMGKNATGRWVGVVRCSDQTLHKIYLVDIVRRFGACGRG